MKPCAGFLSFLALVLVVAQSRAEEPKVVRVRVPSGKVATYFPTGTPITSLPAAEFERLVAEARVGAGRNRRNTPRLLRAQHEVRWVNGVLRGVTEIVVEANGSRPAFLPLVPWTPAIEVVGNEPGPIRSDSQGVTGLWLPTGSADLWKFSWQVQARNGSEGKVFTLSLPDITPSPLRLELPVGMIPTGLSGVHSGPGPSSLPGYASWRYDSARGPLELSLRASNPNDSPTTTQAPPRIWVEGETDVIIGEATAQWTVDWKVQLSPEAPRRLIIDLDPGLEPIQVVGSRVISFESEPAAAGTNRRLRVRLSDDGGDAPTTLRLSAITRVPESGRWTIPSARVVDAVWTGGLVRVQQNSSRELLRIQERNGHQVRAGMPARRGSEALAFESVQPGPVAELEFVPPSSQSTARIRGTLTLGENVPRIEARIDWTVINGRSLGGSLELPTGWSVERFAMLGQTDSIPWHVEPAGTGRQRLVWMTTLTSGGQPGSFNLVATSAGLGVSGPIDVPHLRVQGAVVVEDSWVANPGPTLSLKPLRATGLDWVTFDSAGLEAVPTSPGDSIRGALSWRWLTPEGTARLDRILSTPSPRAELNVDVRIAPDRVRSSWRIQVEREETTRSPILILAGESIPEGLRWRVEGESGPIGDQRSIDDETRQRLGLASETRGWVVAPPLIGRGPIRLIAEVESPRQPEFQVPIFRLPDRYPSRSIVGVRVSRRLTSSIDSKGLDRIELIEPDSVQPEPEQDLDDATRWFQVSDPLSRLTIRTQPGPPVVVGPVVEEAILRTEVAPPRQALHRLILRVSAIEATTLQFRLPPGLTLDRCLRDGAETRPLRDGPVLHLEVPGPETARSSRFELIYRDELESGGIAWRRRLRPLVPDFSVPCLSFLWDVAAPSGWVRSGSLEEEWFESGPGVRSASESPWLQKRFGLELRRFLPTSAPPDEAERINSRQRDLSERLNRPSPPDETLGDLLVRLDGGDWPIVVDRLALLAQGVGPATRLIPSSPETGHPAGLASRLGPLGLVGIPSGDVLVITTSDESDSLDPRAVSIAAKVGHDPSRTILSAVSWFQEPTWNGRAMEPLGALKRASRTVRNGWPGETDQLILWDATARKLARASGSLLLASLGLLLARWSWVAGFGVVGLVTVLAWLVADLGGSEFHPLVMLAPQAFLMLLVLRLGHAFRGSWRIRTRSLPPRMSGSSSAAIASTGPPLALVLFGVVALLAHDVLGQTAPAGPSPIVALLPYDGEPDPSRTPERVILKLADFLRLRDLATLNRTGLSVIRLLVSSAGHVVQRIDETSAQVESRFDLWLEGGESGSWSSPVGDGRELSATLDGRPIPLAISPDARFGSLVVKGAGRHQLVLRRQLTLQPDGTHRNLALPLNPVANAQLVVATGAEPARSLAEVLDSQGDVRLQEKNVTATLGPVESLRVRWVDPGPVPASRPPELDATILWDARPAGDRVRLRWKLRMGGDRQPLLRFRTEAGVLLRSIEIPGMVDLKRDDLGRNGSLWTARVDPPLAPGGMIKIDAWKPALSGSSTRRLPVIEPDDVGRYYGVVGFRRLADWTGRLVAGDQDPGETIEETFARLWGELPEDRLTLSGGTTFTGRPALEVVTLPSRAVVSSSEQVELELTNGRLDSRFTSTLTSRGGPLRSLVLRLPDKLEVWRIQSPRLASWSRIDGGRIQLRFLEDSGTSATVQIQGVLASPPDSLDLQVRRYKAPLPLPVWEGTNSSGGTISIRSNQAFQVEPPLGAGSPAPAESGVRFAIPAGGSEVPRQLSWTSEPPRIDVDSANRLTFVVDRVDWLASLRFNVNGGPVDVLYLELPASWATDARLEVLGAERQLTSETRGEATYWAIRPSEPIWGQARMILHGSRTIETGVQLEAPRLIPRGKGAVRSTLTIVNASSRKLDPGAQPGLEMVDLSALPHPTDLAPPLLTPSMGMRVTSERWRLDFRPGPTSSGEGGTTRFARARRAKLSVALDDGIQTWGEAEYQVESRSGEELALALPTDAAVVWSSIDGRPTPSMVSREGAWSIPLPTRSPSTVRLLWSTPSTALQGGGVLTPGHEQSSLPTLIRLGTIGTREILAQGATQSISGADYWQGLAEAKADQILERLRENPDLSPAGQSRMLGKLLDFELACRSLTRSLAPIPDQAGNASSREPLEKVDQRRTGLKEAIEAAGLGPVWEEMRRRTGGDTSEAGKSAIPFQPVETVRLPVLGSEAFGRSDGRSPVALERPPHRGGTFLRGIASATRTSAEAVLALGLLFMVSGGRRLVDRWRWPFRLVAMGLLVLVAVGRPDLVVPTLGLILIGRRVA